MVPRLLRHTGHTLMRAAWLKRTLDLFGALCGLLLLSPLMALLALLIRWKMGGPVLFTQPRTGKDGVPFLLYKFRTMTPLPPGESLDPDKDATRLTPLGCWLRKTSLDELPSLWNVLRGEMSLVGPRPLLTQYLDLYTPEQRRRHEVKPGITGWAQLHGRNQTTWEQRFAYDLWYVDHWHIGLDLLLLWKTLGYVLRAGDTHAPDHATMPLFQGQRGTSHE